MNSDTPQYIQPPPDPALQVLQKQASDDRLRAAQADVQAADARHALIYGTRMALPTGSPFLSGFNMSGAPFNASLAAR